MNSIFDADSIISENIYDPATIIKDLDRDEFVKVKFCEDVITIRKILSLDDMTSMIQNMLKACQIKDKNFLAPELIDFSFRLYIVTSYCLIKMPDTIDEQQILLYKTDIFNLVISNINKDQYSAIKRAINLYIGFNLF